MKKYLLKALVLAVAFLCSVVFFSGISGRDLAEELEDMSDPTLPVLYMEMEDFLINPMYGYTTEMQTAYVRDCVTPLTTKREMTVAVSACGNSIESVSYKVLSADGEETVESAKVGVLTEEDGYLKAEFSLESRILMNQEYMLCFIVDYGADEPAYYYTRIVQRAGMNVGKYLEFVRDFYEQCLAEETASELTQYLESDDSDTNNSYTRITINSSYDQVTWGSLDPTVTRKAVPVIKEINSVTCTISQDYEMIAQDSDGNTEYYYVEEVYRMRYASSRVMLLDFERNAQQLFDGDGDVLTSDGLDLGIADTDFDYTVNQNADIAAFVQVGELWSYNRSSNKLAHVFGFGGSVEDHGNDVRKSNLNYEIAIIRVEESGDIDFIVSGYMSCGDHEGSTGVSVYHYSAQRNATEELVFIPSTMSAEFLLSDVGQLAYVSLDEMLYLYMGGSLYRIDIENRTWETLQTDIDEDCLAVSESQAYVAWMDQMDLYGSESVTFMNLETGEQTQITAPDGEYIQVLGFINDDLIYGLAKESEIVTNGDDVTFAMYSVCIREFEGEVVLDYEEDGYWVSEAVIEEGLVELCRVVKNGNAYEETTSEEIMNNLQTSEETVSIHLSTSDSKGTLVALDFSKSTDDDTMLVLETDYVVLKEDVTVEAEVSYTETDTYYIYANGQLYGRETDVGVAVLIADELTGVVLNSSQQYVYERGGKDEKTELLLEDIPDIVLLATLDADAMAESLGSDYVVLDLTGCTLDSVLYQVSEGRAVTALTGEGESVVIVGYDSYNTILYNPDTQETYYYGINDSTELFSEAGNVFLSYMQTLEARTGSDSTEEE